MWWHLAMICCIVTCLILSLTYSHFPTDVSFPLRTWLTKVKQMVTNTLHIILCSTTWIYRFMLSWPIFHSNHLLGWFLQFSTVKHLGITVPFLMLRQQCQTTTTSTCFTASFLDNLGKLNVKLFQATDDGGLTGDKYNSASNVLAYNSGIK